MRLYNELDPHSKVALNSAFLMNIKSGRNHQTFHQALTAHQNEAIERTKVEQAINSIFPKQKFNKNSEAKKKIAKTYLKETKSSENKNRVGSNS